MRYWRADYAQMYYCRNCKGGRKHSILFEKEISGWINFNGPDDMGPQMSDKYIVIECCGCGCISFVNDYWDETLPSYDSYGDVDFNNVLNLYPKAIEGCDSLNGLYFVPPLIKSVYEETILALNTGCFLLSAGGFRAIIEAICNDLAITGRSLKIKIDLLKSSGDLTVKESIRLHSVRFLGNDSLHEIQMPKLKQLQTVLHIINHLLTNLYIQDRVIERSDLDVVITEYPQFIRQLNKSLLNETIGNQKSLNDFLGKRRRLLTPALLNQFEMSLQQDIEKKAYLFLVQVDSNAEGTIKYKVTSIPNKYFCNPH